MLPFPNTYEEKSIRFVKSETIDLFCHCRGPDSELMIQCDGCSEWYHVEYERSIPQKAIKVKKTCVVLQNLQGKEKIQLKWRHITSLLLQSCCIHCQLICVRIGRVGFILAVKIT